ncbi:MAG: hypothetical protein HWE21_14265 [Cytophagia bacterium]|nr:hypothetical protein [Cytophagia bacterium]
MVLKFEFENEFGTTEITLSDLASQGNSLGEDQSTFKTSINTKLKVSSHPSFKLTLPPLFPSFLVNILKGAYILSRGSNQYWLRSSNESLKDQLLEKNLIKDIDQFSSFYTELKNGELFTSTISFLGKKEELAALLNVHYSFLKLAEK